MYVHVYGENDVALVKLSYVAKPCLFAINNNSVALMRVRYSNTPLLFDGENPDVALVAFYCVKQDRFNDIN